MKSKIPLGLSIYLDLVRIGSALVVVLSHTWSVIFPSFPLPWPGHSAVVVFFVLSGYVIFQAARPALGLSGFLQHRIARIVPVAVAAIAFSILLSWYAKDSAIRDIASPGFGWKNIWLNLVFLGQSWTDAQLSFNAPFWSLNYEVWYYVIFSMWFYRRSYFLVALAALGAGPRILLLFPVWLLGVSLHGMMGRLPRNAAYAVFCASSIGIFAFLAFNLSIEIREEMRLVWPGFVRALHGSNQFAGDYILGAIISLHFLAAGSMSLNFLKKIEKPVRFLSSITFSAYIFHMPLAILILSLEIRGPLEFYGLLFVGILVLGCLIERNTGTYRDILSRLLQPAARILPDPVEDKSRSSVTNPY